MSDDMEIIRGSGNVFRDLGLPDAGREQLRALLAAKIIGVLDERKLTVRAAQKITGVAAADFSRIRKANLGRFTIDRLMSILSGLGQGAEVSIDVHPRRTVAPMKSTGRSLMSTIQIDRSPDLRRLREAGYNILVTDAGFLIVLDVPHVNANREIAVGALVSSLDLAGDVTVQPQDHTAMFIGEFPCDENGRVLSVLMRSSGTYNVGNKLVAQHSFLLKPPCGDYVDYYQKMAAYVTFLGKHVAAIDPYASARTGRVIEPEDENSPFNYLDTASSRTEINTITSKLAESAVAIVGVGGTGSYVLDLVAKTPVKRIHIFDGDRFLTHNSFRAPGAPTVEKLREQPLKVDYLAAIYSRMHRGIVSHPVHIDASNSDALKGMSFVFLCMEGGQAKLAVVERLETLGIPFIDVGIGLYTKRNTIGGMLRVVASLPENRDRARSHVTFASDDANNEYDKNVQVADLNALTACLAVIAWKKHRGFYFNSGREQFVSYTIANSLLVKGDVL